MKKNLLKIALLALIMAPGTAFAQGRIAYLITDVKWMVNTLITIVAAIALLVFFWGLAKFILKVGGDESAVKEGKTLMIWGLAALFVMVTVWGLIRFVESEVFGTLDKSNPTAPNIR